MKLKIISGIFLGDSSRINGRNGNILQGFVFCLVVFTLCFSPGSILAQNRLSTPIKLTITDGDYESVSVVLKNNTTGESQTLPGIAKFELELKYNCDYVVSFSKPGYITKRISLNTTVPQSRSKQGFHPFPYEVILFKQYDGVNIVIFNQPVGKISYSRLIDDFDYDTDYTKQIQSALKAAEEEIRQKQKEQEKLSAKQRKEEEKLRLAKEEEAKALAKQQAEDERKLAMETKAAADQAAKDKKAAADQAAKDKKAQEEQQRKELIAQQEEEKRKTAKPVVNAEERPVTTPAGGAENRQSGNSSAGTDTPSSKKVSSGGEDARPVAAAVSDSETQKVSISQGAGEDRNKPDPGKGTGDESLQLTKAKGAERTDNGFTMATPVVVTETRPEEKNASETTSQSGTSEKYEVHPDISIQEIKETNRIIHKVTVRKNNVSTVYTRVSYAWGGIYYFRQNVSISENLFFINTGLR